MYIFTPPVQPHSSFTCAYCTQIVVVEESDRYRLETESAELDCPGCGSVNLQSSPYLKNQLERDRMANGFYLSSSS